MFMESSGILLRYETLQNCLCNHHNHCLGLGLGMDQLHFSSAFVGSTHYLAADAARLSRWVDNRHLRLSLKELLSCGLVSSLSAGALNCRHMHLALLESWWTPLTLM